MDFDETKYIPFTAAIHSTEQKCHVKANTNQKNTNTNTNLKSVLSILILNGYYLHHSHYNLCNSPIGNFVDSKPHNGYAISI